MQQGAYERHPIPTGRFLGAPEHADGGIISVMKKYVLGIMFSFVLLLSPSYAHAAGLTSLQVQAILSILASFGVDQTIVDNVRTVLTGVKPPVQTGGTAIADPYVTILSPLPDATLTLGQPVTLTWQAASANSVYLITLADADNLLNVLYSGSVTAFQAECYADVLCSYAWTPEKALSAATLTIRDRASWRAGSVNVSITDASSTPGTLNSL